MRMGKKYDDFGLVQLPCENSSKYFCLILIFADFVSSDICFIFRSLGTAAFLFSVFLYLLNSLFSFNLLFAGFLFR